MEESKGLFDARTEGMKPRAVGVNEPQLTVSVPDVLARHTTTLEFMKSTALFVVSR